LDFNMEQDIRHILQDAILAPSGENCQPWSFRVSGKIIELFNLSGRDQSLYNRGQRGSYIAHGALLKNLEISALQLGYTIALNLFPEPENKEHVATIVLEKIPAKESALYGAIAKRVTNRKPYINKALPDNELNELMKNIPGNSIKISITQKDSDKKTLAKVGGINESVMMSNKFLHNFFFSHVTWTKEEDEQRKVGFFIDTLELPPSAKIMFGVLKNWSVANFLNKFGLYNMVGKQNAKTYASSSGFGILSTKDTTPESFIRAGMALEQLWLAATNLGLNFQPVSGLLFLSQAIKSNEAGEFRDSQRKLIEGGYKSIEQIFSVSPDENIVFMFRFGHGDEPTAKSSRFNIDEVIQSP